MSNHSEPAREAGWKLAPINPTQEMRQAGERAWMNRDIARADSDPISDCYRAMISASPAPAAIGGLEAVRAAVLKLPRRIEPIGGQRHSYVELGNVVALIEQAALAAPAATGGGPYAWVRRWAYDGVDVMAMKKADRPAGWHLLDVTKHKLLHDDVALYTHPAPSETGAILGVKEALSAIENRADKMQPTIVLGDDESADLTPYQAGYQAGLRCAAKDIRAALEGRSDG